MKTCFKCGKKKDLSEFYRHKQMADGLLGKCKQCTKDDVTAHRNANLEKARAYDRKRGLRNSKEYFAEYRAKYPNKYKATNMVSNAKRGGKLFTEPCCECGSTEKIHAHHDDYAKPLNVRWLCAAHHKQWHRDNGEGANP